MYNQNTGAVWKNSGTEWQNLQQYPVHLGTATNSFASSHTSVAISKTSSHIALGSHISEFLCTVAGSTKVQIFQGTEQCFSLIKPVWKSFTGVCGGLWYRHQACVVCLCAYRWSWCRVVSATVAYCSLHKRHPRFYPASMLWEQALSLLQSVSPLLPVVYRGTNGSTHSLGGFIAFSTRAPSNRPHPALLMAQDDVPIVFEQSPNNSSIAQNRPIFCLGETLKSGKNFEKSQSSCSGWMNSEYQPLFHLNEPRCLTCGCRTHIEFGQHATVAFWNHTAAWAYI